MHLSHLSQLVYALTITRFTFVSTRTFIFVKIKQWVFSLFVKNDTGIFTFDKIDKTNYHSHGGSDEGVGLLHFKSTDTLIKLFIKKNYLYLGEIRDMANKVTIQDIADALGVSRNTVSKAINNTGILAEATREKVLAKAIEMGYKQFSYASSTADIYGGVTQKRPVVAGEIAFFTGGFLDNSHFATTMLDKFQNEITHLGYRMTMHRVTADNLEKLVLPPSFDPARTQAIICVEMFYYPYCEMLADLGLPLLLVDAPVASYSHRLKADILMMDNSAGIFNLISDMRIRGLKRIGFVGQMNHCRSFFERYMAFRNAMYLNDLPIDENYCLTDVYPHGSEYYSHLFDAVSSLKEMPDLFICANDFIAIDLINILKSLGLSYPKDVRICGFDDSAESKVMTPALTTCHIHTQIMGYTAANLLLSRIEQPDLNYRTVYAETDLIYRESTE